MGFDIGGHPDLERTNSHHSCGTAAALHYSFPITSGGCSPPEPIKHSRSVSLQVGILNLVVTLRNIKYAQLLDSQ